MDAAINVNLAALYGSAIGKKSQNYYLDKFQKFDQKESGITISWNWAAFFFGGVWALYRKMYGWFFGWWFLAAMLSIFQTVQSRLVHEGVVVVACLSWLGFSIFANSFYHSKIKARIAITNKPDFDATTMHARLLGKSGIHSWVPIAFGAIPVIGILAAVALPAYLDVRKGRSASPSVAVTVPQRTIIDSNNPTELPLGSLITPKDLGELKDSLHTALRFADANTEPPSPQFEDAASRIRYLNWLSGVSERLKAKQQNVQLRKEFLQTVWYESRRAGLDPSLVLGLIETVSDFRKFHVSEFDARGYMSVKPDWAKKLGDGDIAKLFHMQTNLRYGCVLLRYSLDKRNGDVHLALIDYFDENLVTTSNKKSTREQFPDLVLRNSTHWQTPP